MPSLPANRVKFYTAASGGSEVTSGSSDAVLYPRLLFPFTEPDSALDINGPYTGKIPLSCIKTFAATGYPALDKIFEVILPGISMSGTLSGAPAWNGIGVRTFNGSTLNLPGGPGTQVLQVKTNASYFGVFGAWSQFFNATMNTDFGDSFSNWIENEEFIPSYNGSSIPYGDVQEYIAELTIESPVNNTINDISYGTLYFNSESNEFLTLALVKKGTSRFNVQYANRTANFLMCTVEITGTYKALQYCDAAISAGDQTQTDFLNGYDRVSDYLTVTVFCSSSKAINISIGAGYVDGYDSTPRTSRTFNISVDFSSVVTQDMWVYYD